MAHLCASRILAPGARFLVALVRVVNLARSLDRLKEAGFWCIGLDGAAERSLAEAAPADGRIALVLGSEGAGLRRLTRERCDLLARLLLAALDAALPAAAARLAPERAAELVAILDPLLRDGVAVTLSVAPGCGAEAAACIGDARLTLADAPDESYDAIIVDAFTSDAIPIHLLTREAMEVYRNKLAPHGIVGIHISNRHLELASVVAGIAAANGMVSRLNESGDVTEYPDDYIFLETVVAAARSDDDFGPIAQSEYWEKQEPDPDQWVWTDDYCNIIGAILRRLMKHEPYNTVALRQQIANRVIEAGKYVTA